jgi:hypothetical protein
MKVLRRAARREFEDRLLRHLREVLDELPPATAIDAEGVVKSAESVGITSERDVARFGELMYRYARSHEPAVLPKQARNILLAYGVAPAVKLARLAAWGASEPKAG